MMKTPVYQMLQEYKKREPLAFHMPGHLLGKGLMDELKSAGSLDITEIAGADCLHYPHGVIKEAQELAAKCFGSEQAFFLVNGSTSGIHAMVQAVVKPGGKLIIGRDCHISVLYALAMINAEPVFVLPAIDKDRHIPLGVTVQEVEKVLSSHTDAQGILITRPNYYGIASPLKDMAALARRHGIPLLVDEAHGAHFRFHKAFPKPAVDEGADICVQSLHKTLPALTQTALLHVGKDSLVDAKTVAMAALMLQTTSPSYLLMASIDLARGIMENEGEALYEALRLNIKRFDEELSSRTSAYRTAQAYSGFETDFSRIVLCFDDTQLSGFQASELLEARYGIVAEMADSNHVVLIATPFHQASDFDRLLSALEELSNEYRLSGHKKGRPEWPWTLPERMMPLREAMFHPRREVSINEAKGAINAVPVIPYPPGIPFLNPGERITEDMLDTLREMIGSGCSVHGIHEGRIQILNTKDSGVG